MAAAKDETKTSDEDERAAVMADTTRAFSMLRAHRLQSPGKEIHDASISMSRSGIPPFKTSQWISECS
jgi:hypothetical protein